MPRPVCFPALEHRGLIPVAGRVESPFSPEAQLRAECARLRKALETAEMRADWLTLQLREAGLEPAEPLHLAEKDADGFLAKCFAAIDQLRGTRARKPTVEDAD